jgi:subtilisin family serine protease
MRLLRAAGSVVVASAMVASLVGAAAEPSVAPSDEATSSYIVELAPGQTPSDVEAELTDELGTAVDLEVGRTFDTAIDGFATELTRSEVEALEARPGALEVFPNIEFTTDATQNNAIWNLSRIDQTAAPADSAYTYPNSAGAGTRIYIVDTGISPNATEFGSRLLPGVNQIPDGNGTADCNGHGTHVAGTAASATYGVAKLANVVPVRVFGCSRSTTSDILADGLDWILANHPAGTPGIVNLSLGSTQPIPASTPDLITEYMNYMAELGFVMVVAAGNSGADACNYTPSRADYALTVGATTRTDARPTFSNFGQCVDLFAPGVDIRSLDKNNPTGFMTMEGTSMAAPHVAGVAALYWGANPSASGFSIESTVLSNAIRNVVSSAGSGSPNRLVNLQEASLPVRILETRVGPDLRTIDGFYQGGGAVGPGETLRLQVVGRANIPETGVGAVALNVTVTGPTANSFLTIYPDGPLPTTSNLNFTPGQTVPNSVITKVGADGSIRIYNGFGSADIIVDVARWFPSTGSFTALAAPARLAETRSGLTTIDGQVQGVGARGPGQVLEVPVLGRAGIPNDGSVGAVALNVTVTGPTANGFLTVFPDGTTPPQASNLNFVPGQTVPNSVIAKVGADGKIRIYNGFGATHIIVDVAGWYPATGSFTALPPARIAETRVGSGLLTIDGESQGVGARGPGQTLDVRVLGRAGVPATGVGAVALNVTATGPTTAGFLTVYPTGRPLPQTSNLNFPAGQTVPNSVIVPVGADGKISIYNGLGSTNIVVDIAGWFPSTP